MPRDSHSKSAKSTANITTTVRTAVKTISITEYCSTEELLKKMGDLSKSH
jgi:hypothetical protein